MVAIGIGDVIAGKYRVEGVLGRGGMGVVVAARHLRLRERVAIKFPQAGLHDRSDVVARLVLEGQAAMRIHSEHVARVYDVGRLASGAPYLVMQYLVGRDLGNVIAERGPLPIVDAVGYILQTLEALAEAHALGIIHRDLKPSNLFLSARSDGSPLIKVIDFGISKATGIENDAPLTQSDAVLGSRPYMPPEQMRSSSAIDERTDIWAVGATLHTLLVGEPPFLAGSAIEIYERIQRGPTPLRSVRLDAPEQLEAILLRCLMVVPADRYPSVVELAGALAGILGTGPAFASAERTARIFELTRRRRVDADAAERADEPDLAPESFRVPTSEMRTDLALQASWQDVPRGDSPITIGSATVPVSPLGVRSFPRQLLALGAVAGALGLATIAFDAWHTRRFVPAQSTLTSHPGTELAAIVRSVPLPTSVTLTPVHDAVQGSATSAPPLASGPGAGRVIVPRPAEPATGRELPNAATARRAQRLKSMASAALAAPPPESWFDPQNPYVR